MLRNPPLWARVGLYLLVWLVAAAIYHAIGADLWGLSGAFIGCTLIMILIERRRQP